MIVPFPIAFDIGFSVGLSFVSVAVNLQKGDDSEEVIKQFIYKEGIPVYLEITILCAVEKFLEEAVQSDKDEDDERYVLEGDIFIQQAKKWSHSFVDSSLKWNLLHQKAAKPTVSPSVETPGQKPVNFIEAYQWIVSRPTGLSTLLKLEKSYAAAVTILRHGKENSLENLRNRLAGEMDTAIRTLDPSLIPPLVTKHVSEMDEATKKWNREIKELKRRQKQEYHNFIKDYYLSEQLIDTVNEHELPPPSTPSPRPSSTPVPLAPSHPSTPTPTPTPTGSLGASFTKKALERFQFGKTKSEAAINPAPPTAVDASNGSPSMVASLPSSPIPSPLYNNDPLYFLNKEGKEISPKLFFHETIPVYLGRQRKNLFYFKIFSGETIEFCRPKERHKIQKEKERERKEAKGEGGSSRRKHRAKMATSLYGNALYGLVLLVAPDLSYKSDHCKEFVQSCGATTEFHFETFKEQLTQVKSANPKLNSGDFFITKHSNLLHVNVVFHLVIDNADASLQPETANFSQESHAALGLRNIVLAASQCDVHSLVIPAALSEPGLESMMASEEALKSRVDVVNKEVLVNLNRVDATIKTVKLALTAAGEGGSLKTIDFVVPEHPADGSEQPLYNKLKGMLTATNKSQQPAYKM